MVRAAEQARTQLIDAPRWARTRRRELTDTLEGCDSQLQQHPEQLATLDTQISQVTSRLEQHESQWNARRDADNRTPRRAAAVLDPLGQLTRPTRSGPAPTARGIRPSPSPLVRYPNDEPYRASPERGHGRSR